MKKILVVDDDIVMLRLFQVQLKRSAFKGYFYQDSATALAELDKTEPDLAVLDYNMPGVNGIELLKAVREHAGDRTVPVIFVTGEVEKSVLHEIEEHPNTAILSKPFSPRRLTTLIDEFFTG